MSDNLNLEESLSALMDNEASELELRRILKELPEDESGLKQKWERYHLLSAALKQETHTRFSVDLLSGIHAKLENEPLSSSTPSTPSSSSTHSQQYIPAFFKKIGQVAIAASVALGVLFTANLAIAPAVVSPGAVLADASAVDAERTTFDINALPEFNGDFMASELTRVVRYEGSNDGAARDRLRQAVYRELDRANVKRSR